MRDVSSHAVWLIAFAATSLALPAFAQGSCPAALAGLMPKAAVRVSGQYNSAGIVGLGFAAGELPFANVCVNQVTKTPGHVSVEVKHYEGEGVELFAMQIDGEEQQRLTNARQEFEQATANLHVGVNGVDSVTPFTSEAVPGGTLLSYGSWTDCSEGTKRSKPTAKLLAVAHNGDTAINVEINGFISVEAAKAAAVEILASFAKNGFHPAAPAR